MGPTWDAVGTMWVPCGILVGPCETHVGNRWEPCGSHVGPMWAFSVGISANLEVLNRVRFRPAELDFEVYVSL